MAVHPVTQVCQDGQHPPVVIGVPGDRVTIVTAAGPSDCTVSGTIDGPGILFKTSSLVRAIGVLGENVDPSEVERAVAGRARVLTGDERAVLEPAADARKRWIGLQVITGLTALSTFAAIFLVASTFSLSVLQRRRELGLWRAIGATPGLVCSSPWPEWTESGWP